MGARVVCPYVRAFTAPAAIPCGGLDQTADSVRVETEQKLSIGAVRLLDLSAEEVVATAREHLDAVLRGYVGKRVRGFRTLGGRQIIEHDACLPAQR